LRIKHAGFQRVFADLDHADGNVERCSIDAWEEAIGDDSNVICLDAPLASHGVAQFPIHSRVASQGTGLVNVHNADMAVYRLSTSTATAYSNKFCALRPRLQLPAGCELVCLPSA
jgi:hypothetical protein